MSLGDPVWWGIPLQAETNYQIYSDRKGICHTGLVAENKAWPFELCDDVEERMGNVLRMRMQVEAIGLWTPRQVRIYEGHIFGIAGIQ